MEALRIPLSNGMVATIDQADYEREIVYEARPGRIITVRICDFTWHADKQRATYYAVAWHFSGTGIRSRLRLHRLIAGAAPGQIVDHIDDEPELYGLNNRRSNLRIIGNGENVRRGHAKSKRRLNFPHRTREAQPCS